MKISVIITSYNYAQYLKEAIDSVINQTYSDWELIIIDDGSFDNSVEIINSYCEKDNRIKLFQHKNGENKGLKESLLLGIKYAQGEWIAFLESDDVFEPDNLLKKVKIIEKYGDTVDLVFNKVDFLIESTPRQLNRFKKTQEKLSKMTFPKNMFHDFYIDNQILTFSCVLVRTETIQNANFEAPLDTMIDWWLWIHIAYESNFYYINEELTKWRLHDKSYIDTGKKQVFCPISVNAYGDIYKTNKSLILFCFIIFSTFKLFFIRGFRFLKNFCLFPKL